VQPLDLGATLVTRCRSPRYLCNPRRICWLRRYSSVLLRGRRRRSVPRAKSLPQGLSPSGFSRGARGHCAACTCTKARWFFGWAMFSCGVAWPGWLPPPSPLSSLPPGFPGHREHVVGGGCTRWGGPTGPNGNAARRLPGRRHVQVGTKFDWVCASGFAVRQQDMKGSVFAPDLAVWQLAIGGSGHLCPCVAARTPAASRGAAT
jgi:hypothetical protein